METVTARDLMKEAVSPKYCGARKCKFTNAPASGCRLSNDEQLCNYIIEQLGVSFASCLGSIIPNSLHTA